jgi:hypothetical protein
MPRDLRHRQVRTYVNCEISEQRGGRKGGRVSGPTAGRRGRRRVPKVCLCVCPVLVFCVCAQVAPVFRKKPASKASRRLFLWKVHHMDGAFLKTMYVHYTSGQTGRNLHGSCLHEPHVNNELSGLGRSEVAGERVFFFFFFLVLARAVLRRFY